MTDAIMNNSVDMDMTDENSSNTSSPIEAPRELLLRARGLIDQGKAPQALQAVVMAMRIRGGDVAVVQILQRARELYRNRVQESSDADQLASLFAECAIAEAQPVQQANPCAPQTQPPTLLPSTISGLPTEPNSYNASILAETGRRQIMVDAFSDGSSFICLKCGGLVSLNRKDEHYAYWCTPM